MSSKTGEKGNKNYDFSTLVQWFIILCIDNKF